MQGLHRTKLSLRVLAKTQSFRNKSSRLAHTRTRFLHRPACFILFSLWAFRWRVAVCNVWRGATCGVVDDWCFRADQLSLLMMEAGIAADADDGDDVSKLARVLLSSMMDNNSDDRCWSSWWYFQVVLEIFVIDYGCWYWWRMMMLMMMFSSWPGCCCHYDGCLRQV